MSTAAPIKPVAPEKSAPEKPTPSHTATTSGGYDVARPHGRCFVSNRTIEPGEKFMAALRETPQGFERLDVSVESWEQFDRTGVLAFWQAVMPRAEAKKRLFVDDTVLSELFERLGEATEPVKLNFRFVLGLILMRKRLVIYDSTRTESDREVWRVRMKGRDDLIDLLNPKLNEQQIVEVSQQLNQVLSEEL
jgi:hypothetical protein